MPAAGIQRSDIEGVDPVAQPLPVRCGEVVDRLHDAAETGSRAAEVAGAVDACREQHGVVRSADLVKADIRAHVAVEPEIHSPLDEFRDAALDRGLVEFEVRNAVDQKAAGAVVAVVDPDAVALAPERVGRRKAGRTGTNNADGPVALERRRWRANPPVLPSLLGDVALDRANGHGTVAGLLDDAITFAEPVLRADPPADLRKRVGRLADLVRLLKAVLGHELQPVGDVVVERAVRLAGWNAALRAACGLLGGALRSVFPVDLAKIRSPVLRRALLRHPAGNVYEGEHSGGHGHVSTRWESGTVAIAVGKCILSPKQRKTRQYYCRVFS